MTPETMISIVASAFGLTAADLTGLSRQKHVVLARHAAAWVLRRAFPTIGVVEIGQLLGHRDHTTICYAIGKIEQRIAVDPTLRAQLHDLLPSSPLLSLTPRERPDHAMRWWVAQARDSFFVRAA